MEKDNIIVSANGISIGYTNKKVKTVIANDVTINLKAGSFTALIGANGIGKSTLLRTLTGIQLPLKGEVILNGKNINNYTAKELAQNLSIVLTEGLPPSNLTVYELVALGRQPYTNWLGTLSPEDDSKVNEALALTQLTALADKKHYEVSDGQLQSVLIARALAQDTPVIILDEPTTHLDLLHKVSLLRLLKQLTEKTGKSILYSTHDLDLALQLSDEIIVMTPEGTVQNTPEKLIESNVFDTLFTDSSIVFDKNKNGFTVL
ncbi:ABC transporter ATP-binding protein [Flavobacterium salilacus subsp. salilacus]|uniref:ABC transporter ATP-binding protein n=1 Tax=Flavobacterium TaxID=237 RepID=UPI001074D678|nr:MULTISPECIES: ABC transporter ATP-binding protein [Flavobacterium]KAF2518475.1 ABC transporter ATP-binding protein [Flavobacterium salilacus subsp. salilacus]MBE1615114.1 ABC transporter ATP-binding protein [Flavobacterium sp. SaA2.13]